MSFCKNCGAVLGVGRFCTNCGTAVQPTVDVARPAEEGPVERTNVRLPAVQPDAAVGARFPLFADEHPTAAPTAPAWMATPAAEPAPAGGLHRSPEPAEQAPRGKLVRVLPLVLALACVLALGIWLGTRGDDGPDLAASDDGSTSASPSPTDPTSTAPAAPTDPGGPPVDLASETKASGPKPISPGVDLAGKRVTYPVSNVLDGDPTTAYRIPGDASGEAITLSLPSGSTVLEVGIVNGYAKKDSAGGRTVDWYDRNRRVRQVEWVFDDGTTVVQDLTDTKELQVVAVNSIESDTVVMRIIEVTGKPTGEFAKDVTAVSEIVVRGRTS